MNTIYINIKQFNIQLTINITDKFEFVQMKNIVLKLKVPCLKFKSILRPKVQQLAPDRFTLGTECAVRVN